MIFNAARAVCLALVLVGFWSTGATHATDLDIRIGILKVQGEEILPLSRLDLPPEDLGFAGARLGQQDNTTTGSFLGHRYDVLEASAEVSGALGAIDDLVADGAAFIVLMAEADQLLGIADHLASRNVLVFNAQAEDNILRQSECRDNLFHVASSRAMYADGLAQFLMFKRWDEWFLVHGSNDRDKALADALRQSATKFGARIVEEREFEDRGGARRTDSGHVLVQRQIPVFTQGAPQHDVVVTADESEVFAGYLPYHTWESRPVAGSAGLRPVGWHPANEAWGATQYQRRFEKLAGRTARTLDFQVWLALRVIGEGVTRTNSADPQMISDYIRSENFEIGVFKGVKVGFRRWNNQLRSPIMLVNDRMLVSVSPQDGFLHQRSLLDTIGIDKPNSSCTLDQ